MLFVPWYYSDKDDTNPQVIEGGNKWQLMTVNGKTSIVPKKGGYAFWAYYLRIGENPNPDPIRVQLRWLREPNGIKDFTGQGKIDCTAFDKPMDSRVWMFKARKGQPIAIQIKHTGELPITLATREMKSLVL